MLTATRETRSLESMGGATLDGHITGNDPDEPLQQTVEISSRIFHALARTPPSTRADVRRRVERLFRTVLGRAVCTRASSDGDRPILRQLVQVWIDLASELNVAVPTVA